MKLTMKNIGVIRDGEIELDGITVLAGLNGTGKSTASKALYSAIAPYVDLVNEILEKRADDIGGIILGSLLVPAYGGVGVPLSALKMDMDIDLDGPQSPLFYDLANKSHRIPEQYEEWVDLFPSVLNKADSKRAKKEVFPKFLAQLRNAVNRPDTEYVQYLASRKIQSVFDGQINTIGVSESGEISLMAGQETRIAWMNIEGNKVTDCSGKELAEIPPVYLDTRHVLDALNESKRKTPYTDELYKLLKESLSEPTFEEYKSRERIQDMIASVIHGKLAVSTFGEFMFKDNRFSEPISLRNVASGNKTFAVLQRLIENGALRENAVLIIDEPESNQHPQWQLKLAETLILLHKELGVRLFLNTHSTYFLRAIEVYSNQYELSSRCHYYQTQPVDGAENLFRIQNVDGKTKLIYHEFYLPFEEL